MFKRLKLLTLGRLLLFAILFIYYGLPGRSTAAQSITPVLSSAPTAEFEWSMPERFGPEDENGIVDYHWDSRNRNYPSAFVNPQNWKVNFNACGGSERPTGIRSFTWEIQGQSTVVTDSCKYSYDKFKTLGIYPVKLTVTADDGQISSIQKNISPTDLLIVSLGDSFAGGQGNPDVERHDGKDAKWVYSRCHRSANAGPARAALKIEKDDPHTSVTFISYACSGAQIRELVTSEQKKGLKRLPPQIRALRKALNGRAIDALIISAGGNDTFFSGLVTRTILKGDASQDDGTKKLFEKGLATLEKKYTELRDGIATLFPIPKVFITEYPDLLRNSAGNFCADAPPEDRILQKISCNEAKWASQTVIRLLNEKVAEAAEKHNWIYVDQIASNFAQHGYCSGDQRWVNTFEDAVRRQGRSRCLQTSISDCIISPGSVHPNNKGHDCFSTRIIQALQANGIAASRQIVGPSDLCAAPSIPPVPQECPGN